MTAASHPMAWADDAACRDLDPDLFYIEGGAAIAPEVAAACRTCPVHTDCHTWALRRERFGYWAGTSERARRKLRRTLGITLAEPEPLATPEDIAS